MEIKDLNQYSLGGKKPLNTTELSNYPSIFQRNFAAMVDATIVFFIRFILACILCTIWYVVRLKDLFTKVDFTNETAYIQLFNLGFLYDLAGLVIAVTLLGGLYYVFMLSSSKSATIGYKLFDIKLVDKKTGEKISFTRSLVRYLAYLVPILFILLVGLKVYRKEYDILLLILVVLTVLWYDIGMFSKIKGGMPDLIAKTKLISLKQRKKLKFQFFK